jgi:hypothetical protein
MAGRFNLEDYDTVESRIKKFWEQFPNGRIHTQIIHNDGSRFIVQAWVFTDRDDQRSVTSGMAEEIVGSSLVTKTSALEVCETSAIGRALANFIFSGNKRPSREEMEKVERYEKNPRNNLHIVKKLSPEEIARLEKVIEEIQKTDEIENLRKIWTKESEFLDEKIQGTTIKDALNKRVQELS